MLTEESFPQNAWIWLFQSNWYYLDYPCQREKVAGLIWHLVIEAHEILQYVNSLHASKRNSKLRKYNNSYKYEIKATTDSWLFLFILNFSKSIVSKQKTQIGSWGKIRQKLTNSVAEKGMGVFFVWQYCVSTHLITTHDSKQRLIKTTTTDPFSQRTGLLRTGFR